MNLAGFCPGLDINSDFVAFIYLFIYLFMQNLFICISVLLGLGCNKTASCRSDKLVVTTA